MPGGQASCVALLIGDYAMIGDRQSAALVGNDGSIDWFCAPRFDSPACFAALVGTADNGRWLVAPADPVVATQRRYVGDTMTLETTFACASGTVALTDVMVEGGAPRIVRTVRCVAGRVAMRMELVIRFDYGSVVPWVRRTDGGLVAVGGPDGLRLASDVALEPRGLTTVAAFTLVAAESVGFELASFRSYEALPAARAPDHAVARTEADWHAWSADCKYAGDYRPLVMRSLVTLNALTYPPTGGIVAAPTTSLPETIGGVRNWDYRYCWLRDATFTLYSLMSAGERASAERWRRWLLRAIAGDPRQLQIVYGLLGQRRIPESDLDWLGGYEGSKPVRLGNGADGQFQLDVYGEVVDLLFHARRLGLPADENEWPLVRAIVCEVERRWREPDRGLWEMRGEPRHFTHSKVMAWVALDRAVRSIEEERFAGPLERWRAVRDEIHGDVCAHGYDPELGSFVQSYGSKALDASCLLLGQVGFVAADDPRFAGTVAAIVRELDADGFVLRYRAEAASSDDLPGREGAFLACSFWLVDALVLLGRRDEARALFERLAALVNDVGLLSEEYDAQSKRLVGNFPQAFSHVGLINSAFNLAQASGPAVRRAT